MKKIPRAAFVGLIPVVGCGEPSLPEPVDPSKLSWADRTTVDSTKTEAWRNYLQAAALNRAWSPPDNSPWLAYHKVSLPAAVSMVRPAAVPVRGQPATLAEQSAEAFASRYSLENAAVFVDLPGPESVAWGAALARRGATPVCTFNNWPHHRGILKLEQTLGALLYYADELSRQPKKPTVPVFMLELERLRPNYTPRPTEFDNRYFHLQTDFPTAADFARQGIKTVYYVSGQVFEQDDLNDYFVSLKNGGLDFFRVQPNGTGVDSFTPTKRTTIFDPTVVHSYTGTSRSHIYHRHYGHYYGFWRSSRSTFGSGGWVSG